jgi:lipoprotein-anchoring transpeptidase ErfK/SrfK
VRLASCALAFGLALAAPAAAGSGVNLSNEQTVTQWAHPAGRAPVRVAPSFSSHSFTRLRPRTEDGLREVYEALRQQTDSSGAVWVLVVRRGKLRATLYRNGRAVFRAPVGVGMRGLPTPAGHFYVRERLRLGRSGGPYGPLAFGTSAYSPKLTDWPGGGVVGIHGTNEPQAVPGRPSHGCVRMRNRDILRLGRLMPVGTPVLIL